MAIGIGVSPAFAGAPPGVIGGGGSGSPPPAVPTLTAPAANANVFNSIAVTVSATSTDGDLDRIDWVLDPGGGEVVIATDSAAPYSQSWTPTGVTDGAHTLVARAVRGAQHTDSASITVNVGEVLHSLVTSVTCLRAWQSDFGVHDAGGGVCDSWVDAKSGVSAAQATGANQPAIVANAYGSHTALRFDGTNDLLNDTTLDIPPPGTTPTFVWGVVNRKTWVASHGPWSAAQTTDLVALFDHTATPSVVSYNGVLKDALGLAVGTLTRTEQFFNNAGSDYVKLGTVTTTATTNFGNNNPAAGWLLGSISTTFGWSDCDILACLVFNGKPSAAELSALSAAAAAMYPGIAA